ncbi:Protein of unknown function DUF3632 [Penicillium sp. IBT 31633x]|nr:Protein of unknown function DUF3632 [Penicillium sp. IBT 31633x]
MSTSNYESWFEMKAKDRDYRSARPHTEVVRQLLINTVDPTTAATKLISLDYTNGDTPWALWNLVYEAAADFDSSHSSLLALLGEFQKADSHIPGSKAEDKPSEWLACFGSMWRDKWDILSPHALSGWTMSTSQTARRWNNINAFSAKLLATTSFSRGAKLRAFGLASLRRCLETDPNTFKVQRKPPWYRMDLTEMLAADVCAAAQWPIHAGGLLWEDTRLEEPELIRRLLPGQTELWKGEQGLTKERWQLWKERFMFMAKYEDFGPNTRQIAQETTQIMGKIY